MSEQILYIKANIDDLNAKLDQADKSLKETGKQGDKTGKTISKGMDEGSAATDGLNAAIDETGNALGGLSGTFGRVFRSLSGGIKTAVTSLKGLRLAIIGTGIGALLIAVTSLAAAFKTSEEGQNKFAKILAVIGAVTGVVTDLFSSLGDKIIWAFENPMGALKSFGSFVQDQIMNRLTGLLELIPALGTALNLVFKGEFSEAGKVATDAVGKVVLGIEDADAKMKQLGKSTSEFLDETNRKAQKALEIADMRAKADMLARDLLVEQAKAENQIADLRLKSRQNELYDAKQRADFTKEAMALTDELASKQENVARIRRDALVEENKLSRSNKEALDAEAQAEADLINIQTQRANNLRNLSRDLLRASNEQAAIAKAETEARKQAEEQISEALRTSRQQEIHEVRQKYANLTAMAIKYGMDTVKLEQKRVEELNAIDGVQTIDINKAAQERIDKRLAKEKDASIESIGIKQKEADAKAEIARKAAEYDQQILEQQTAAQLEAADYMFGQLKVLFADNAEATKAFTVFDAVINAYLAITKVLAQGGIAGPALAVGIGALAFANVAKIISEPVPSFHLGTDRVKIGKNPKGRDTIPAMLDENEAVITAKENLKYPGLAKAWNAGTLDKYFDAKVIPKAIAKLRQEERFAERALFGAMGGSDFSDKNMVGQLRRLNRTQELTLEFMANQRRSNPYRA